MNSIDYSYRPESYFEPLPMETSIINRINGTVRRRIVRERAGNDLSSIPYQLTAEVLDEVGLRAWGRIHPMYMGGEFLPRFMPGEVEIARVCLKSTTYDADSIRARKGANRIRYRYLDEYDGEMTTGKTSRTSIRPLTLGELLNFMFRANLFFEMLDRNFPGELEKQLNFFTGESEFYPQFHDALVEKTIEHFFSEHCPDDEKSMEDLFYSVSKHEEEEEEETSSGSKRTIPGVPSWSEIASSIKDLFCSVPEYEEEEEEEEEIEEEASSGEMLTIPGLPSWIEMAAEDDPIYKRGFVFGGTYSSRFTKSAPETGTEEKKSAPETDTDTEEKGSTDISMTGAKRFPSLPSWIKEASEDDPIYKRGLVFGGTYSSRSTKSNPVKTEEPKKEPMTIEEEYEEAMLRLMKEKAAEIEAGKKTKN
ncbi:MAG: hypothetical protein GX672_05150 [Synergistaceae bacterium]|nr:hypothetical protein [Synergistaceae bacterium]